MKQSKTNTRLLASLMMSGMAMTMWASVPEAPTGLTGDVQGIVVNLSWDATPMGDLNASNDFESAFPGEGWQVKTTDTNDPCFTWFQYPTSNYTSATDWQRYIYEGEHSAFVQFDLNIANPGDKVLTQDEWLISPRLPGARYLSFRFLINSVLLDNGAYEEFPNDYFVKVSRDDGATWTDVWNARYDMKRTDDYQQAVICLGEPCDEMRVAFVAVSDPAITNAGLYFSWALDDVRMYAGRPDDALVKGFNVYRDDTLIASGIHYNSFSDTELMEIGEHTYSVSAVGEEGESERTSLKVLVEEPDFNPPLNFSLTSSFNEETQSYDIRGQWEAPEGDFKPSWYEVWNDGSSCAWIGPDEPLEFEQSYVPAGTYSFEVFAVYDNPYGESDHVVKWITVGGRSLVTGLQGSCEGNDVSLEWGAPTDPDINDLKAYVIRRGREIVADDVTELKFTDTDVPDGLYRYSVSCLYNDGTESAARKITILVNRIPPMALPHVENFNAGELPENWDVGTFDNMTPDDYIFRFDDPSGLGFSSDGFDGAFVSADSNNAEMLFISTYLTSPVYDLKSAGDGAAFTLEFNYDYPSAMSSAAVLEYSTDLGATWNPWSAGSGILESYDPAAEGMEEAPFKPKKFSELLSSKLDGFETAMFRIRYEAQYDWHFALDNWKFYDANAAGISGIEAEEMRLSTSGRDIYVKATGVSEVAVFDISGLCVAKTQGTGDSAHLTVSCPGIYTVRVTTADSVKTKKIAIR